VLHGSIALDDGEKSGFLGEEFEAEELGGAGLSVEGTGGEPEHEGPDEKGCQTVHGSPILKLVAMLNVVSV
jgi:hypothetical protein